MAERLEKINAILNTSGIEIYPTQGKMIDPIQLWLRKVQHIANEVENILDLIAYEKVRRGLGSKIPIQRRVRFFFSSSNPIIFRQSMAHRISSLNKTIKEVEPEGKDVVSTVANLQTYNNANASKATTKRTDILKQTREFVEVSNIVGREEDEERLVDMLCSSHNHPLSVVALIGVGGLGKTTIAKKLMENERLKVRFGERICIAVSQDFDILKILNNILEFIDERNGGNANSDIAVRKLKEALDGKTYLLVLDDVWNTNQQLWNAMRSSLECIGRSKDSVILVTTRDNVVAQTMRASSILLLPELSDENSLFLFKQIAFANRSSEEDILTLENIGEKIVRKCKGVPLAIKTLGGILQTKRTAYEWEIIEKSELWDSPPIEGGILPSLKLSYDYLPSRFLKKCFTLCAAWPRGIWFEKYELVERWMALDLIQESNNKNINLYDVAEEYFNILLGISFILVSRRKKFGEAIGYSMHDLVYDLARSVAMHERLYLEAGKKGNNVPCIQHVSVFRHEKTNSEFPKKVVLQNIRTLEIYEKFPRGILLKHGKYLRVLSLEHVGIIEVPKAIARLKCLKYLDLIDNPIQQLPECIMELYNLQSLILYWCKELSELPRGLHNLVNLQHLGLSFDYCPAEGVIRQLSHLQILPPLQLSDGGFKITELENLNHIRGKLEIKGLQLIKSKQDAKKANLSSKARVDQACLIWDNDDNHINHEAVLNALYPNPHLKKLLIKGYAGDNFPLWLSRKDASQEPKNATFCNIQNIQLVDCGNCQQLPTLGDLPCLKILEITKMDRLKYISLEFYCGVESQCNNDITPTCSNSNSRSQEKSMVYFPSLKELRVRQLANLVEWYDLTILKECTIFPCLEVLAIEDCPMLITTPKKFPSLTQFIVKNITSSQPLLGILSETSKLTSLKSLYIETVKELTYFPHNLMDLSSLQVLKIRNCKELVSLLSLSDLCLLREIEISQNISIRGAPKWLQNCKSLEKLWFNYNCPKLEAFPDLKELSRLSNLSIIGITTLISEPTIWLYTLPCVSVLHIGGYTELNDFPDISPLLKITSLKTLYVYGWEKLQGIPKQLQLFKALQCLLIYDFENLEQLPNWIQNLSSIERLGIARCNRLKKLASMEAMERLRITKLRYMQIEDCPLLEENIKPNGLEYQKIARLHVEIFTPSNS